MRLLHVITGLTTGGAETTLQRLLASHRGAAGDTRVVALGREGVPARRIRELGIEVEALGLAGGRSAPAGIVRLTRLARGFAPDLVQGWMYHGNLAASLAARLAPGSAPVIWNVRQSLDDDGSAKRSTARVIRAGARWPFRPARIVYNSRLGAEQHARLGYPADVEVVIPNGLDPEEFRPDPGAGPDLRRELGVEGTTPLVGLVGRFHPVKDHAGFLAAASALAEARPDVRFVLVGPGIDRENGSLRESLARRRLGGRVHLLGERDDVPRITAGLDVATCCSLAEAFPNVVLEAMACAVPCVTTDVGDAREVLGDGGLVVPRREPGSLASAWARLLAAPAKRRAMGEAGRRRVLERFTLAQTASRYERLYGEILAAAPPAAAHDISGGG
jgi:glycosyltransferase involved in cell wall biosynthesis